MAMERKNICWKIDLEFYKKLREVVQAGAFKSISFIPWHKGCDTNLDATCDWPELKDLMETWYYEIQGEIEIHTYVLVTPEFTEEKLILDVITEWDHCADCMSEVGDDWDEEKFQELVFNLLPKRLQDQTHALDLLIWIEIEYDESAKSSITEFSISLLDGKVDEDLAASLSSDGLREIREHVVEWCLGYFCPIGDFSAVLEANQISTFSTYASEKFLMIPDPPEREPENFHDLTTPRPKP